MKYEQSRPEVPDMNSISPIFICSEWPRVAAGSDTGVPRLGYAMIALADDAQLDKKRALAEIKDPTRTLLLVEHDDYFLRADNVPYVLAPTEKGALRHESKAHYLFMDGHVRGMSPADAKAYIPQP
jgi:prepilin-type processing-associated H-X9-DG protein